MTPKEFDATRWGPGMVALYRDEEYAVMSCDFEEHLICLRLGDDDEIWVRCENVTLRDCAKAQEDGK